MNALVKQDFNQEQVDLIKQTVARGATDNELKLFLYAAHRTGLDPLTKQIYFIKRRVWNPEKNGYDMVGTIQTGIDGYRVIAARNGLAGIDDAVFDSEDKQHPNKASVTVYRLIGDNRVAFTASARWAEYVQTKEGKPIAMWAKMPYLMLGKVAESLALRKAFPADLSGVYTSDEMPAQEMERVDPQTGEITTPKQIEPPNKTAAALVDIAANAESPTTEVATDQPTDWKLFGERILAGIKGGFVPTPEQQAMLERMKAEKPRSHSNLMKAMDKAVAEIANTQQAPQEAAGPKPEDDPDAYRVWLIDQLSQIDTGAGLNSLLSEQQKRWDHPNVFPPDVEDWNELFKERAAEIGG